jgi:hypothetical protein
MKTKPLAVAFTGSLLIATALTPVRAADMTNERALNPQREPQNWILLTVDVGIVALARETIPIAPKRELKNTR